MDKIIYNTHVLRTGRDLLTLRPVTCDTQGNVRFHYDYRTLGMDNARHGDDFCVPNLSVEWISDFTLDKAKLIASLWMLTMPAKI